MPNSRYQLPRPLCSILGDLFTRRGYGRLHTLSALDDAWRRAVGEPYSWQTRVTDVRHGILNVLVTHSALLEELNAFRKCELLSALRSSNAALIIRDIRFSVGTVNHQNDQVE